MGGARGGERARGGRGRTVLRASTRARPSSIRPPFPRRRRPFPPPRRAPHPARGRGRRASDGALPPGGPGRGLGPTPAASPTRRAAPRCISCTRHARCAPHARPPSPARLLAGGGGCRTPPRVTGAGGQRAAGVSRGGPRGAQVCGRARSRRSCAVAARGFRGLPVDGLDEQAQNKVRPQRAACARAAYQRRNLSNLQYFG